MVLRLGLRLGIVFVRLKVTKEEGVPIRVGVVHQITLYSFCCQKTQT